VDQPLPVGEAPPGPSIADVEATQVLEPTPTPVPRRRTPWWAWLGSPIALLPTLFLAIIVAVLLTSGDLSFLFRPGFWSFRYFFDPQAPATTDQWAFPVFLVGSALTAGIALLLATLLSLALAVSIAVYLPGAIGRPLGILTNLLAGIPSVVYGIWGYVVLAPYFGLTLQPGLRSYLGWIPFFGGPASAATSGTSVLLAAFILTIMVVPLTTAIIRDAIQSVPAPIVEASLALGATEWETTRRVRLRVARAGVRGAIFLGFGRAIGESVAVAMVIGAQTQIPPSIYSGATTVSAFLLYQQDSAFQYPILLHALVEFALVLLLITLAFNLLAQRATGERGAVAQTSAAGI
jgi:phosphate transport system permease protein